MAKAYSELKIGDRFKIIRKNSNYFGQEFTIEELPWDYYGKASEPVTSEKKDFMKGEYEVIENE